ncbi:MAG TPA: hypothetical protein VD978_24635, partial [Azospirillum sp.]|nr:hypothetical protein [Azospirillum sp.]
MGTSFTGKGAVNIEPAAWTQAEPYPACIGSPTTAEWPAPAKRIISIMYIMRSVCVGRVDSKPKCNSRCITRAYASEGIMGTHYSHVDLAERRQIQQMRDAKVP